MDSEEKIRRGQQAAILLKDPLIEGFFTAFEQQIFNRWANEPDEKVRNELYLLKVAGDAFKTQFHSYIATGQFEANKLEKGKTE